jgi:hypothetical protein
MTKFINYTPHQIVLNDGRIYLSMGVARVSNSFTPFSNDVCDVTYGDVTGLPTSVADTYYIVSAMVLAAAKVQGRTDCVAPATGHPDCIRKDGFIVSVPGFVR